MPTRSARCKPSAPDLRSLPGQHQTIVSRRHGATHGCGTPRYDRERACLSRDAPRVSSARRRCVQKPASVPGNSAESPQATLLAAVRHGWAADLNFSSRGEGSGADGRSTKGRALRTRRLTTWVSAARATWSHRAARCKPSCAGHVRRPKCQQQTLVSWTCRHSPEGEPLCASGVGL